MHHWNILWWSSLCVEDLLASQVICQLNNRNEDYEFDLQELSDQYESEIEQILKDTAEKVNSFKRQLEDKQEEKKALEVAKVR